MLQIVPETSGNVVVMKLTGQLVQGTESRSLIDQVNRLLLAGSRKIVIDLAGVGFIDSGGVGELVAGYSSTRRAGGELVICGAVKMVREVLRIVRLPTMISLFETAAEAEASLNASPPECR